jgi:hypothetical protein
VLADIRYNHFQNDPYRSLLELFLVVFALRTLFSSRTRGEGQSKNWVELTDKVSQAEVSESVAFRPDSSTAAWLAGGERTGRRMAADSFG